MRAAEALRRPALVYGFAAIVLPVFAVLTWRQAGMYTDMETLWRTTLAKNPDSSMAHNNLGHLLGDQGHIEEAMGQYQKAIQCDPNNSEALNNLGFALASQGRYKEAIESFRMAIQLHPNDPTVLNNLGISLTALGRFEEAIENFRQAIQLKPNYCEAMDHLGIALANENRCHEAIESYRQAIQIKPNSPEIFLHWGMTLSQLGHSREAVAQYREALKLNPDQTGALNNLAWILASNPDADLRNGAEAVRLAEHACELTHYDNPLFVGTLAAAYAEAGRFPEAVATAEKAEQLATKTGLTVVATKNRQLLELYEAGKPYHAPVAADH